MLGVLLAEATTVGHGVIGAVLIALLLAVLVAAVLYVVPPTRPYAGLGGVITLIVFLLLLLV